MSEPNGTKSSAQLRAELKECICMDIRDLSELMTELEAIYNERSVEGKTPSESFERLILYMRQEYEIYDHPDRDVFYTCSLCGRK